MRDEDWVGLPEEALERLLVERWVCRGMVLGVVLLSAALTTFLGVRGIGGLADQVTVAALVALGLAAGGVAFAMRQRDLRIHQELRRRRSPPASPPR